MSPAIMRELSESSTSVPLLNVQLHVEKAWLTSFLANEGLTWRLNMVLDQSELSSVHSCLMHFFLHPDKIIGDWVRNLDFRLGVCQNEKKSLFYFGFLTLARRRIFFCGFWCIKKDLLITKHFIDTELDVYIFFCHMEIYQLLMSNKVITIIIGT